MLAVILLPRCKYVTHALLCVGAVILICITNTQLQTDYALHSSFIHCDRGVRLLLAVRDIGLV